MKRLVYFVVSICLIWLGCGVVQPAQAITTAALFGRIIPAELDHQIVYPSKFVSISEQTWQFYQWQAVQLPQSWVQSNYYYEIWDSHNKPVPGFVAKRLDSSVIELNKIDASLYPKIRLIIFKAPTGVEHSFKQDHVQYSYTQNFNTRLAAFVTLIILLYLGLLVYAIRYRLGWRSMWLGMKSLLRSPLRQPTTPRANPWVHPSGLAILTVLYSGIFGIALGYAVGGVQIVYVLIKLPFLLLGALVGSLITLIVLSFLLGVKNSVRQILNIAFQLIAVTALGLASFTPIILFYIMLPQNHDQLLISTIIFFVLAGLLAAFCLARWLYQQHVKLWFVITVIWIVVYGLIFLQLGWLLRPWVGVVDDVSNAIPFSRLYSGNVFTEIWNTVNRAY